MTSSLVGSEMCIRDSFKARPRQVVASAAGHDTDRPNRQNRPDRPDIQTCLLYTSDAADDM
eukprot:10496497-Prorocentrum_lima.AAC.1